MENQQTDCYIKSWQQHVGWANHIYKVSEWVISEGADLFWKTFPMIEAIQQNSRQKQEAYLTGVLGLPGNFRGERTLGSKENFSFRFSSTDGATYVKPWGQRRGTKKTHVWVPPLQRPDLYKNKQKQATADDEQWKLGVNHNMQFGGRGREASRKSGGLVSRWETLTASRNNRELICLVCRKTLQQHLRFMTFLIVIPR